MSLVNHPAIASPLTLTLATANTLNLALPGRVFYENQEPYTEADAQRKFAWLGHQIRRLNADLLAFQEVWDEAALRSAVHHSQLRYAHVIAPGSEAGAVGTPRVGLATRWVLESSALITDFPAGCAVAVPELGDYARFERPVLHALVRLPAGGPLLHVLVLHLKSNRPKFLLDAAGEPVEDRDDPRIQARAQLRALLMRAAEAAALRSYVVQLLSQTRDPLVLLGDLNDGPHSVTTQMIAATQQVAYDRQARDTALFHAHEVQTEPLRRDVGYSHIYQGTPDILDQIWVSEELLASSRFSLGEVLRVEHFNDHLHEGRDRTRSDHGFVRAVLKLYPQRWSQAARAAPSNPPL
jgi:endonuclease/exonuclease/phosphatase family metal-dependent hydrolase